MGWRKTFGAEIKNKHSKPKSNIRKSSKSPTKEPQNIPFATFAHIADRNETLKFYIPKMSKCLHGLPCHSIYVSDHRQICRVNGQPIFDMEACPMKKPKWFASRTYPGGEGDE